MEKPVRPKPEDFGTSEAEIESLPAYAESQRALLLVGFVLVACFELYQAAGISPTDWQQHWLSYVVRGIALAVVGLAPAGIIAMPILGGVDRLLKHFVAEYARINASARAFRAADKTYEHDLFRHKMWVRNQEAIARREKENYWKSLSGVSFERELGHLFKRMEYQVRGTRRTGDGGVDLILEKAGKRTVVQCKAHASKVGIGTARELVASMIDFGAHRGILATISGVTQPVHLYVKGKNIEILDLDGIMQMQRTYGERQSV